MYFDPPPIDIQFVNTDRTRAVILERIVPDTEPEYRVVGKTKCLACDHWCWLGSETHGIVLAGTASPLCIPCAAKHVDRRKLIGNARDSR